MNAFFLFFRGWLGLYFVLMHFVVPFYLVAIYPETPEPAVRLLRGFGYGVISGPPSELGFWYRFLSCGAWVLLGLLFLSYRIRQIGQEGAERKSKKVQREFKKKGKRVV